MHESAAPYRYRSRGVRLPVTSRFSTKLPALPASPRSYYSSNSQLQNGPQRLVIHSGTSRAEYPRQRYDSPVPSADRCFASRTAPDRASQRRGWRFGPHRHRKPGVHSRDPHRRATRIRGVAQQFHLAPRVAHSRSFSKGGGQLFLE
jgi:hypothetical protein